MEETLTFGSGEENLSICTVGVITAMGALGILSCEFFWNPLDRFPPSCLGRTSEEILAIQTAL